MSKKKKTRTQQLLDQKRQLQQQLISTQSGPSLIGRKEEAKLEGATPEKLAAPQLPDHQPTGMRRTVISSLIIVILLAGAVVANEKTSYIHDMGDSIYNSLRLNK